MEREPKYCEHQSSEPDKPERDVENRVSDAGAQNGGHERMYGD